MVTHSQNNAAIVEQRPYMVAQRLGPGLARITTSGTAAVGLWARVLGDGRGWQRRRTPARCANCGAPIAGAFYKPPPQLPPIVARLCLDCVEGKPE